MNDTLFDTVTRRRLVYAQKSKALVPEADTQTVSASTGNNLLTDHVVQGGTSKPLANLDYGTCHVGFL